LIVSSSSPLTSPMLAGLRPSFAPLLAPLFRAFVSLKPDGGTLLRIEHRG